MNMYSCRNSRKWQFKHFVCIVVRFVLMTTKLVTFLLKFNCICHFLTHRNCMNWIYVISKLDRWGTCLVGIHCLTNIWSLIRKIMRVFNFFKKYWFNLVACLGNRVLWHIGVVFGQKLLDQQSGICRCVDVLQNRRVVFPKLGSFSQDANKFRKTPK